MAGIAWDIPLYLASTSPRRVRLLREAGMMFEQIAPPFDDSEIDLRHIGPVGAAEALAFAKAASVAEQINRGIIIGCDTLLAHDDQPIGKPRDVDHARRILTALFDQPHQVISGVALYDAATHHRMLFHDQAAVVIDALDPVTLEAYLASGQWRGKAGGYNLAELADVWSIGVTGDPTTVIGLPMRLLTRQLEHFATHDLHTA